MTFEIAFCEKAEFKEEVWNFNWLVNKAVESGPPRKKRKEILTFTFNERKN